MKQIVKFEVQDGYYRSDLGVFSVNGEFVVCETEDITCPTCDGTQEVVNKYKIQGIKMTKQDVKEIVKAHYPEVGGGKYVPKLPEISDAALAQMEAMIEFVNENHPLPSDIDYSNEILKFIDKIKDERAKR